MEEDLPELNFSSPRFSRKTILSAVVLIILLISIPIGVYLVQHTQIFKPKAFGKVVLTQNQEIDNLTNQLIITKDEYNRAGIKDKAPKLKVLLNIASTRKVLLNDEASINPALFLKQAKLVQERASYQAEVQEFIEQEIAVTGKLSVVISDDFKGKKSQNLYFLKTQEKVYKLYFAKNPPRLFSDSIVSAQGVNIDSNLVLYTGEIKLKQGDSPPYKLTVISPSDLITKGEQKTAAFVIKLDSDSGSSVFPYTTDDIKAILFTDKDSVDAFYRDNSFNLAWFTGQVYGSYLLSSARCGDFFGLADQIDQLVSSQGVDLSQYSRLVYVVPSCGGGFKGTLGGSPSRAWILDPYGGKSIFAHELGHNLGVHHASSLDCGAKAVDSYQNCFSGEYGDLTDVMDGSYYHFNAPHKLAMNWTGPAQVTTVTSNGQYTISDPLEIASPNKQIIAVPKVDTNETYYLAYRRPVGFDQGMADGLTRGVTITIWNGDPAVQTKLIDTTPETGGTNKFNDAALSDDKNFFDYQNFVSIKQISHTDHAVTVEIKFNAPTPTPTITPTPTLTPTPVPVSSLLSSWQTLNPLPTPIIGSAGVSSDNYFFVIGGEDGMGHEQSSVYSTKYNQDGTTDPWLSFQPLPKALRAHAATSVNGYIYVLGGYNGFDRLATVYFTKINSDGTISPWSTTTSMPKGLTYHTAVNYKNYIFVVGGDDQYGPSASVYYTSVNTDGTINSWLTASSLPVPTHDHLSVVSGNNIYVMGGMGRTDVYYNKINSDGTVGSWMTTTQLPQSIYIASVVVYKEYLIITVGTTTYVTKTNSDGSLGNWFVDRAPPISLVDHISLIGSDKLFLLAGRSTSGPSASVYSSAIQIPTPTPIPSPTIPGSKACLQVITPAKNPATGECKTYPTSCIPEGWVKVSSCTIL